MLAAWIFPGDAGSDTFDPPPVDRSEGGTGIPGQHGIREQPIGFTAKMR